MKNTPKVFIKYSFLIQENNIATIKLDSLREKRNTNVTTGRQRELFQKVEHKYFKQKKTRGREKPLYVRVLHALNTASCTLDAMYVRIVRRDAQNAMFRCFLHL